MKTEKSLVPKGKTSSLTRFPDECSTHDKYSAELLKAGRNVAPSNAVPFPRDIQWLRSQGVRGDISTPAHGVEILTDYPVSTGKIAQAFLKSIDSGFCLP